MDIFGRLRVVYYYNKVLKLGFPGRGSWEKNLCFCGQCGSKPHVGKPQYIGSFCGFKYPQGTRYGVKIKTLQNMYFQKFFQKLGVDFKFWHEIMLLPIRLVAFYPPS